MLKLLDLFSGIGGFSLGLETTGGFRTHAFVETDPFCRKVLRKHWPDVPIFSDIRGVTVDQGIFDIMAGGFPCQDVSHARSDERRSSLLGEKSGLWTEFARLIDAGRPEWVVIENVPALINRGLSLLLHRLSQLGYDAEWHIIPAWAVGFPHSRRRLWIIAHTMRDGVEGVQPIPLEGLTRLPWTEDCCGFEDWLRRCDPPKPWLLRSRNGVPSYVDRLNALGNAIVPQVAYFIGKAIMESKNEVTT